MNKFTTAKLWPDEARTGYSNEKAHPYLAVKAQVERKNVRSENLMSLSEVGK